MITGFNTDIEFDGIVYHIQTEDKGVTTPVIMSLVYNRGTILASKRLPYDDLLNGSLDEKTLAERLRRQHKLICAAISAGRIEDLKEMSARNLRTAAAKRAGGKKKLAKPPPVELVVEAPETPPVAPPIWPEPETQQAGSADGIPDTLPSIKLSEVVEPPSNAIPDTIPSLNLADVVEPAAEDLAPISKPAFDPLPPPVKPTGITIETPPVEEPAVIEAVDIVTEEPVILVDAVEAVSDLAGTDRPESYRLNVDIIGETRFKGGERKDVCVMVCRGSSRKVVATAEVMVKVLGSSFRPVICHAVTDTNGLATITLKIPQFQSGRATVIARAISEGEEVEIRRAVAHG